MEKEIEMVEKILADERVEEESGGGGGRKVEEKRMEGKGRQV